MRTQPCGITAPSTAKQLLSSDAVVLQHGTNQSSQRLPLEQQQGVPAGPRGTWRSSPVPAGAQSPLPAPGRHSPIPDLGREGALEMLPCKAGSAGAGGAGMCPERESQPDPPTLLGHLWWELQGGEQGKNTDFHLCTFNNLSITSQRGEYEAAFHFLAKNLFISLPLQLVEDGKGVFAELSQAAAGSGCLCLTTAPNASEKKPPLSAFLLLQILSPTPCAAAGVKIRAAIIFC